MLRSMPQGLSHAPPSGSFDGSGGGSEGDVFEGFSPSPPTQSRSGTAGGIGDVFQIEEQPAFVEEFGAVALEADASEEEHGREQSSSSKDEHEREHSSSSSSSKQSEGKDWEGLDDEDAPKDGGETDSKE